MAKPRIFVSSTFYDLRQVRADIERFIKDLGYEPVLNELGHIAYGKDDKLEEYCYKEISSVDIVVSIIGGRFGSSSHHENYSISQIEFKTALELNKQVYTFIDKDVFSEYHTYLFNKTNKEIKYRYVDNINIYEFIEYIENLPNNNNISSFETSQDVINYLKEQWSGLFQRFLSEQTRLKEIQLLKGIESTANTLSQLVNFLTEERKDTDKVVQDILLSNHPAMEQIRQLLSVNYRVFFTSKNELEEWLKARGFKQTNELDWLVSADNEYKYEAVDARANKKYLISINKDIFTPDEKLKVYSKIEWKKDFIKYSEEAIQKKNDDLPF